MGEAIDQYFENIMAWTLPSDYIRLSGRDIIAFTIGFLVCLVIWAIGESYGNKHRRQN